MKDCIEKAARLRLVYVVPVILVLLVVVGMLVIRTLSKNPALVESAVKGKSVSEIEVFWRIEIKRIGGARAYGEFSRYVRQYLDPSEQHTSAHIFGVAAYKELHSEAMTVCNSDFSYGCYHEVFGRLILDTGVSSLRAAVEECEKTTHSSDPCEHALGHGLVASFGYDIPALRQALGVCGEQFFRDPFNGCVGGVFMEHNLRTVLNDRPRGTSSDGGGWYAPCSAVQTMFQRPCYYSLPQWWYGELNTRHGNNSTDVFSRMGELCRTLPDPRYERDCLERIGMQTASASKFDTDETKRLCSVSTNNDPSLMLSCMSYGAFIYTYEDATYKQKALMLCDDFTGTSKSYCQLFAENKASKLTAPPFPAGIW